MFSGAGGLSEGFFKKGYNFLSHIEMDSSAASSLHTRSIYYSLKNQDNEDDYYAYLKDDISKEQLIEDNHLSYLENEIIIKEISKNTENSIIKNIELKMGKLNINNLDGIIGGPPCQAYSIVGRGRDPRCMKDDPRNFLYKHYLKFLKVFDPSFFVFENVPGMKSAQNGQIYSDFQKKLRKLNYNLSAELLNSADFGVLQSRKRLILIGFKSDELISPENSFNFESEENTSNYMVNDLFIDLPALEPGEGTDSAQEYAGKPSKYLRKMNIRNKKDVLINHHARYHNERDREIYKNAIMLWNNKKKRLRYDDLPQSLKTHKNTKVFRDRYKVVAGDLPASHTIVAHIAKDGHYHIHPDINQLRSLTVREAARIQTFPDNFKFEGSRFSQYKQVGNAVPPLMAEKIAEKIKLIIK